MTSTQKPQDHSQRLPWAARQPLASARLAGSPERTSWPVAAKPSLWPPPTVWPRGPLQPKLSQAYRTIIGYFDTVGLTSNEAHPLPLLAGHSTSRSLMPLVGVSLE
jgi:hypothetical protein